MLSTDTLAIPRERSMPGPSDPGFDTLALHAGAAPDPATGARALPIHLSTSFVFESSEHAASLFNLERSGHVYSRISNPTNAVFEERMAALEGGVGSIATASGQAALHLAIATLAGAGAHVVSSSALYGGSHNLLAYTLPRFGIETTFVKPGDIDGWRAAIRPQTRLLFGETLGNPGLDVLDIPTVSAIAHDAGVPLLVDSTFTTPYLMRPFDHGADPKPFAQLRLSDTQSVIVWSRPCEGLYYSFDGTTFTHQWPFPRGSSNPDNCTQAIAAADLTRRLYISTMAVGLSDAAHVYANTCAWTAGTPCLTWAAANTNLPTGVTAPAPRSPARCTNCAPRGS